MRSVGWLPQLGHRTSRRRAVAAALVVPDASNLRVWLDGDDIDGAGNTTLTNGNTFAAWTNKGTLGGTMAQATAAFQPTYRTGFGPGGARPAPDFDGDDRMASSLAASAFTFLHDGTGCTIYTVAKTSLSGGGRILATSNGSLTPVGMVHRYFTGFSAGFILSDGAAFVVNGIGAAATVTNGSFDVLASTLASADTPDLSMYTNGTSVFTANAAAFSAADAGLALTVGASPNGGIGFTGPIYQSMIYQGSHDATLRDAVLAFLVAKAGVASYPAV